MDFFESIKKFFSRKEGGDIETVPDGYCPNCWGTQEYGGKFFDAVKLARIDRGNIDQKKGWIQDYANKNLSGIRLQHQGNEWICNRCSVAYKESE